MQYSWDFKKGTFLYFEKRTENCALYNIAKEQLNIAFDFGL